MQERWPRLRAANDPTRSRLAHRRPGQHEANVGIESLNCVIVQQSRGALFRPVCVAPFGAIRIRSSSGGRDSSGRGQPIEERRRRRRVAIKIRGIITPGAGTGVPSIRLARSLQPLQRVQPGQTHGIVLHHATSPLIDPLPDVPHLDSCRLRSVMCPNEDNQNVPFSVSAGSSNRSKSSKRTS